MDKDYDQDKFSYRLDTAISGQKVPVINEVHLHSIYDPIQEAVELSLKYQSTIKSHKNILILGLGLGYHVLEILKLLKQDHLDDAKIVVVEPFYPVIEDCRIHNPVCMDKQVSIICEMDIEKLYTTPIFIEFLLTKPGIIYHQTSFNIHSHFFKSLITFRSSPEIKEISRFIENEDLKKYLLDEPGFRYDEKIEFLKKDKKILDNPFDFFLLGLDTI